MRNKPVYLTVEKLETVPTVHPWWKRLFFWRDYTLYTFALAYAWEDAPEQPRSMRVAFTGDNLTPKIVHSLFTNSINVLTFDSDEVNR